MIGQLLRKGGKSVIIHEKIELNVLTLDKYTWDAEENVLEMYSRGNMIMI